ncbi:MAG: primosomal protein N' [Bdellovibrionales bacterium]|nr:primosomal protein N' [Bdellovibrionales bacterium]
MTRSDLLVSVAVPRPLDSIFTYRISEELAARAKVGSWVLVPFGKSKLHAFIIDGPKSPESIPEGLDFEKLKTVLEVGPESAIIPSDVLALCRWTNEYYHSPLGEVLHAAMPASALGLKNAKREPRELKAEHPQTGVPKTLTAMQQEAVSKLEHLRVEAKGASGRSRVALLHGVTGSGKTEVYLTLARNVLREGRSVLILAPEIALTPQLHENFENALGQKVGLWHSALPDGQRRDQAAAMMSGKLRVVVGARSAVFCPLLDLGLIVVDEEHDSTYKQEDRVRYQARDLAVVRGKITDSLVILGSATPSMETLERVRQEKYQRIELTERVMSRPLPDIEVVSLSEEPKVDGIQAVLAEKTLQSIREVLDSGNQAMVFLNRRGFAAFLICEDCSEVSGCPHCSISLTVHRRDRELRCHVCGYSERIPQACASCRSDRLLPVGAGTESLEEELPALLPQAKVLRLDRDQITSATRLSETLERFRRKEANLLLGTQMLVKGHDFPGVTLVVVILADALFRYPDFRAPERALQILTQVSGRAGRGDVPGKVMIQTYSPDHPVLQVLQGEISTEVFLEGERELRQALHYPPFGRLARIRVESASRDQAKHEAHQLSELIRARLRQGLTVELLGPSEAFLERAKGIYRWDLLLKSTSIVELHQLVHLARKARVSGNSVAVLVDIDPSGIG